MEDLTQFILESVRNEAERLLIDEETEEIKPDWFESMQNYILNELWN